MKKLTVVLFFCLLLSPWHHISHAQIRCGAERTELYLPLLKNQQVAICTNPTGTIGKTHIVDSLNALQLNIVKIFAPEHGFRGDAEAGAVIQSGIDTKTGIPVVSLYGKNKKPSPKQLEDVDYILFDIQDVGCRFYTYISTLHYIMEAAAEQGVKVLILDRPNPNGYFVDGPILNMEYQSFVGMHPIPVVHGMTIGEYGMMINGEKWLANGVECDLQVIPVEGYDHTMRYSLPIPPSPNLQTDEAIYLYPSLCLFEGTDISVGRGTPYPFQQFGHPDLKVGEDYFTPVPIPKISENPPQKGKKCRGINLTQYAQKELLKGNSFNVEYLLLAYQNFPNKEHFFTNKNFFDKLAGSATLRWQIINGRTQEEIEKSWQKDLEAFKQIRSKYLLYPDFE